MFRLLRLLCALLSVLLTIAGPLAGQTVTATTGAINGTVLDTTKGVLPGVTVSATSSALMGVSTAVTDRDGAYRFSALSPGQYKLSFELPGFAPVVREGIEVGVGFTATVNIEMSPGTVNETLVVTGAAPVVDVTSTAVATSFGAERLATLPGSRDFFAVINQAPGVAMSKVDVGGSQAIAQQGYTSYGLAPTGGWNRHEIEGIRTGAAGGGTDFFYPDFASFAEIAVQGVGNSAEMPTPGTYARFISKSGGNEYHGNFYTDYQNARMQGHNISADQIARGVTGGPALAATDVNRVELFRDLTVDFGGYLKKDKLWWYAAYRYLKTSVRFPFLLNATRDSSNPTQTGKVTFNLNSRHKLIAYVMNTDKKTPIYFLATTTLITPNAVPSSVFPVYVWKVEYNAAVTDAVYYEVRVGQYHSYFQTRARDESYRFADVGANTLTGAPTRLGGLLYSRPAVNGSINWFKNGWAGNHNIKVGMEILWDSLYTPFGGLPSPCNCQHTLNNGVPTQVQLYAGPNDTYNAIDSYGYYIEDSWQLNRRVSLALGIRLDQHRPFLPEQEGPRGENFAAVDPILKWDNWGPRVGISTDLTGDGKTVVKANWGQFYQYPGTSFASQVNPNTSGWSSTYTWTDSNGNGHWDPGEEGRLISTSGGRAATALDPHVKNTYVRQASLYLEREAAPNVGVRTGFVWNGRRESIGTFNRNRPLEAYTVPVQVRDPGPDGRLGTADDGGTLTAFNLAPEFLGLPPVNLTNNLPGNDNHYTWEISATRRQVGFWSLMASFAQTWSRQAAIGSGASFTPNSFINTDEGIKKSTTWQAKVNGTLVLPKDFRVSPIWRHQAGDPFGRTFVQTLNWGNATILAEPVNARREPNLTVFDVRSERVFQIRRSRVTGFFDVYNIFNTNAEQDLTQSSGVFWLRPLDITPPRVARLGVRLQW